MAIFGEPADSVRRQRDNAYARGRKAASNGNYESAAEWNEKGKRYEVVLAGLLVATGVGVAALVS